jgi:hypothetical protein
VAALERCEPEDYPAIISELAPINPALARHFEAARATFGMMALFAPARSNPPAVQEVADALDMSRALRFRGLDDFADGLLDCIDEIAKGSKDAVDLFDAKGSPHEKQLQAYVKTRLEDLKSRLMPNQIGVGIFREPKEGREEPDFVAFGAGFGSLCIPIEVKWSHNASCVADLKAQLGERYLLRSHRTHGAYLVGFSGLRRNTDRVELEHRLRAEAADFSQQHPHLKIDVRVLDVTLVSVAKQRKKRSKSRRS